MKIFLIIISSFALGVLLTSAYFNSQAPKIDIPTGGACKIEIVQD